MCDTLADMDTDALRAAHGGNWKRLHTLAGKYRLNGNEIDELALLYRQGTADLAAVRSLNPDADVIKQLSSDLARSRARLTGTRGASWEAVSRWFRVHLPAALWDIRWWTVGVMLSFIVVAALQAWWILRDPQMFSLLGTKMELEAFAHDDFVQYYSQDTNAQFGMAVWLNNAYVSLQCVGGGITGVFPVYVLIQNAQSVGVVAAVVIEFAGPWHFFRFILPHGLPELTAIFISAAAGLRVFWAVVVPGPMTRRQAIGRAGRAMMTVAGGVVILLFVSGILEGFVTPSDLPDAAKVFLGAVVTIGVWVYTLVVGGRAARSGFSGDLEEDAGHFRAVAG